MSLHSILVKAAWDEEAKVWVAVSQDLPGLVTEAETTEELREKLQAVILDLVELNGPPAADLAAEIPLYIMHEQVSKVRLRV